MRITRLLLGFVLTVIAIWVVVSEQMTGASANAFVNARLSTLNAPIAGRVALQGGEIGAGVSLGERLGSVVDPLVDRVRLEDLEMERAVIAADRGRLERAIKDTEVVIAALEERTQRFAERQIAELTLRRDFAIARAGGTGETFEAAGFTPLDFAAQRLEGSRAEEDFAIAENALGAALSGVFIGNGYNDAPNSEQRRIELVSVLDGLEADLVAAEARAEALEDRLEEETLAVNRLTASEIASTVDGRIWEMLSASGEHLQRGQPILRLLDCGSLFVTLSVTENIFNRLRIGDPAAFRMSGIDKTYPGTIIRLAGSGALSVYDNLAVAPGPGHLERFDVAISVPDLTRDAELDCPVGRTGRVFFESRPLDIVRTVFQ